MFRDKTGRVKFTGSDNHRTECQTRHRACDRPRPDPACARRESQSADACTRHRHGAGDRAGSSRACPPKRLLQRERQYICQATLLTYSCGRKRRMFSFFGFIVSCLSLAVNRLNTLVTRGLRWMAPLFDDTERNLNTVTSF